MACAMHVRLNCTSLEECISSAQSLLSFPPYSSCSMLPSPLSSSMWCRFYSMVNNSGTHRTFIVVCMRTAGNDTFKVNMVGPNISIVPHVVDPKSLIQFRHPATHTVAFLKPASPARISGWRWTGALPGRATLRHWPTHNGPLAGAHLIRGQASWNRL